MTSATPYAIRATATLAGAAALVALASLPALAQKAPQAAAQAAPQAVSSADSTVRAAFIMRKGNDTVAVENFDRAGNRLHGVIQARGTAKGEYVATIGPGGLVPKLELIAYSVSAPQPIGRVVLNFIGDSVIADFGNGREERRATKRGAMPWVNPSFVFAELLAQRARAIGGTEVKIPLFTIAGAHTVDATVTRLGGDSLDINLSDVVLHVHVDSSGRLLSGTVPAQGVVVERVTADPSGKGVQLSGPDYAAPANAPYTSEDVRVATPGGFTLAGTLTIPKKRSGPVPAVVMITGSGPNDRDESIGGVSGYRPFRQIADTLGRRGVAVLRLDDRGYGASGGNASQATTADFADDTRAALAYLRTRREIDAQRLFLVGHSEGGIIAPLVAWTDPSLRGMVLLAGPVRTGLEVMQAQLRNAVEADTTIPKAKRDSVIKAKTAQLIVSVAAQPWTRYFAAYDPAATARKVRTPVLILQGATDLQVSPDQAQRLEATFRSGGNKDVTARIFPGLDHLFLVDPNGNPANYGNLPSKQVGADVLGAIADWIVARSK